VITGAEPVLRLLAEMVLIAMLLGKPVAGTQQRINAAEMTAPQMIGLVMLESVLMGDGCLPARFAQLLAIAMIVMIVLWIVVLRSLVKVIVVAITPWEKEMTVNIIAKLAVLILG